MTYIYNDFAPLFVTVQFTILCDGLRNCTILRNLYRIRQCHFFGDTPEVQQTTLTDQKNAYYGLVFPHSILNRVNIAPCFTDGSIDIGDDYWLETVTLI